MPTSFRYSCFISWGFPCDCPGERRGRVGRRLTRRGGLPPRSPRGLPRVDDGVGRGRFKEAPQRAERGLLLAASALNAFGRKGPGASGRAQTGLRSWAQLKGSALPPRVRTLGAFREVSRLARPHAHAGRASRKEVRGGLVRSMRVARPAGTMGEMQRLGRAAEPRARLCVRASPGSGKSRHPRNRRLYCNGLCILSLKYHLLFTLAIPRVIRDLSSSTGD